MKLQKIDGFWRYLAESGISVPINQLVQSADSIGFTREEIVADVISKKLRIEGYEDASPEALIKYVSRSSFWYSSTYHEYVEEWIVYKNHQLILEDRKAVLDGHRALGKRLDHLLDVILAMGEKITQLSKALGRRSTVTLRELHESVFFQYNLRTLRNKVSKNKSWNDEKNLWESFLDVDDYLITFKKYPGHRNWITNGIDLSPKIRGSLGIGL